MLPRSELDAIEAELDAQRARDMMNQTMLAQWSRVSIAMHRFVWTFVESVGLVSFLDWLSARLERFRSRE